MVHDTSGRGIAGRGEGKIEMMDVGFIGLGTMGRPMAGHLQAAGYRLFVHDVGPSAPEVAAAGGGARKSRSTLPRAASSANRASRLHRNPMSSSSWCRIRLMWLRFCSVRTALRKDSR